MSIFVGLMLMQFLHNLKLQRRQPTDKSVGFPFGIRGSAGTEHIFSTSEMPTDLAQSLSWHFYELSPSQGACVSPHMQPAPMLSGREAEKHQAGASMKQS